MLASLRRQRSLLRTAVSVFLLLSLSSCTLFNPGSDPSADTSARIPAAVASAHPLATLAGLDILAAGGNAVDAAIAVAASLGVVEPYSAGLGGGGFWLLYDAGEDRYRFIDAREAAPAATHRDYYLDADGRVNRDRAINGPSAAGIPGQPAAFAHLSERYGQLPLQQTLATAIQQARDGFAVDEKYRSWLSFRLDALRRYPESARIFLQQNEIPAVGHIIRQPDLADTLTTLARQGQAGFYQGQVAERLLTEVRRHGGDWSAADLADYRVIERQPLQVQYGELEVISAPPPSSGGIALIQMLNMLNHYPWQTLPAVQQTHLLTEVMRRAYRDRAEYLGDPDFTEVPVSMLLAEQRAADWVKSINMDSATPSLSLNGSKTHDGGFHTTHLSVIDHQGNMVSATLSINLPFGSAFTAAGTGVLLNNEMDDFSAKPGEPNAYGLVGNEANAIAPGKRPLSSMTPTIINSPQQAAILGTPGGSRIISMVFLGALEHLQGKPVEDWVSRPRFHHQYLPDRIEHEPETFSADEQEALQALGHQLHNVGRDYGNMQAILWNKATNRVSAAADPRGLGHAAVKPLP